MLLMPMLASSATGSSRSTSPASTSRPAPARGTSSCRARVRRATLPRRPPRGPRCRGGPCARARLVPRARSRNSRSPIAPTASRPYAAEHSSDGGAGLPRHEAHRPDHRDHHAPPGREPMLWGIRNNLNRVPRGVSRSCGSASPHRRNSVDDIIGLMMRTPDLAPPSPPPPSRSSSRWASTTCGRGSCTSGSPGRSAPGSRSICPGTARASSLEPARATYRALHRGRITPAWAAAQGPDAGRPAAAVAATRATRPEGRAAMRRRRPSPWSCRTDGPTPPRRGPARARPSSPAASTTEVQVVVHVRTVAVHDLAQHAHASRRMA